eukprot:XP_011610838.1 PREDICTED: UPF0575 protein C19orf67 homolog [Takifugu rubripes]
MADSEVPTEVVESLEAVFDKLDQELDMANLDHCCHLAEESSCLAEPPSPTDAPLAPPRGAAGLRCPDSEQLSSWTERILVDAKLVLQSFMRQADDLQDHLSGAHYVFTFSVFSPYSHSYADRETVVNIVQHFLQSCQPFFNKLEAVARDTAFKSNTLPYNVYTMFVDVSQQLCDRLKQLLLTCESFNLLSLADSDPLGISHFTIGQSDVRGLRLTTFVYCKPAPYLSQVNTGLYKCMRWNVEIHRDKPAMNEVGDGKSLELDMEKLHHTEHYFLCYEDILNPATEAHKCSLDVGGEWVRKWSIGLWSCFEPNATTDDIVDWLQCPVPTASFQKVLMLDKEPSSWYATDLLLQLFSMNQS